MISKFFDLEKESFRMLRERSEHFLKPYLCEAIRKVFNTTKFWNDILLDHVGLLPHKSGPNSRVPLQFSSLPGMDPINLRPSSFLSPFPHTIDTFYQRKKSSRTPLLICPMLADHSSLPDDGQTVRSENNSVQISEPGQSVSWQGSDGCNFSLSSFSSSS